MSELGPLDKARMHVLEQLEAMEGPRLNARIPVRRAAREARHTLMERWNIDAEDLADYIASLR